ncbi:MAG: hypothetical protein HUK15_05730 [Bacteroidales bacterium]|nr:hypothetical protein [Bacteroidales bacterium]
MERKIFITLLTITMGFMGFYGCEKPVPPEPSTSNTEPFENQQGNQQDEDIATPHNVILSYTGCHSNTKGGWDPTVTTDFEDGILRLNVDNFRVNCAMDSVFSEYFIDSQTIKINLCETNPYDANCVCPIDVCYSIDNIPLGSYELIITHYDWVIYQQEITCEE